MARLALMLVCLGIPGLCAWQVARAGPAERISLPGPDTDGNVTVEAAISQRRSVRRYTRDALTIDDVAQLLWAAQGHTGDSLRAAPSAGALYPLEIYVVVSDVEGLEPGVYHYEARGHRLVTIGTDDVRKGLSSAALGQEWVRKAPAVLVITGVYERTKKKYRERGRRYVHMEVGFVAENIYLQATARGLGTVIVGAFHDDDVRVLLALPDRHRPLALMPVGRR